MALAFLCETCDTQIVWEFDFKHAIGVGHFRAHCQIHEPFDRTECDAFGSDDLLTCSEHEQCVTRDRVERFDAATDLHRQFGEAGDVEVRGVGGWLESRCDDERSDDQDQSESEFLH